LLGPFGTNHLALPVRVAYWVPLHILAWTSLALLLANARINSVEVSYQRGALHLASVIIFSILFTLGVGLWAKLILARSWPLDHPFALFRNIVPTIGLILVLELLRASRSRQQGDAPAILPTPLRLRVDRRLWDSKLIALQAQDHYVRVLTEKGECLIHARFSDIVDCLGAREGFRVHRSWWVARGVSSRLYWRRGTPQIILEDKRCIPVSRNLVKSFRKWKSSCQEI